MTYVLTKIGETSLFLSGCEHLGRNVVNQLQPILLRPHGRVSVIYPGECKNVHLSLCVTWMKKIATFL